MLYGLLLDRMYLSVKNGWIDKQGRVYQYFTIKSAQEKLHFGHEKICMVLCQEKVQIKNDFFHLASTLPGKLLLQL